MIMIRPVYNNVSDTENKTNNDPDNDNHTHTHTHTHTHSTGAFQGNLPAAGVFDLREVPPGP